MKLVYCSANIYLLLYISHFLLIISCRHLKHTADKCTCAWEFKKPFIFCFITLRCIQAKINEQISFKSAPLLEIWLTHRKRIITLKQLKTIIIRWKLFFLFIGREQTTWLASNCLQRIVCPCALSSNREWFLWSMHFMLLGNSFVLRPNSRAPYGTAGPVVTICL